MENTLNPETGKTYLRKIDVELSGEKDEDGIILDGYLKQAYAEAQEFCCLLSKRTKVGVFLSMLILKRMGSTILAGENTARKMLAWTEEGRQILEEVQCLRELIRFLSLNRDCDPKYELVLEILRKGAGSDRISWHEKGCIIFFQYYDSANYVAESLCVPWAGGNLG